MELLGRLCIQSGTIVRDRDIYSDLESQPGLQKLIEEYIQQVRQTTARLEQAVNSSQIEVVRFLCTNIHGSAGNYGFKSLAALAADASRELDTQQALEKALPTLRKLIVLGNAISTRFKTSNAA
jgi:HPt (histidine-containing phosphotransfer) domain-containing protein